MRPPRRWHVSPCAAANLWKADLSAIFFRRAHHRNRANQWAKLPPTCFPPPSSAWLLLLLDLVHGAYGERGLDRGGDFLNLPPAGVVELTIKNPSPGVKQRGWQCPMPSFDASLHAAGFDAKYSLGFRGPAKVPAAQQVASARFTKGASIRNVITFFSLSRERNNIEEQYHCGQRAICFVLSTT